jgi:hypothetical protein
MRIKSSTSTDRTTINIRAVGPTIKARLHFLAHGRGMSYAEYLDKVTRLHVYVERAARESKGVAARAWLTAAGLPLGGLEPPL